MRLVKSPHDPIMTHAYRRQYPHVLITTIPTMTMPPRRVIEFNYFFKFFQTNLKTLLIFFLSSSSLRSLFHPLKMLYYQNPQEKIRVSSSLILHLLSLQYCNACIKTVNYNIFRNNMGVLIRFKRQELLSFLAKEEDRD